MEFASLKVKTDIRVILDSIELSLRELAKNTLERDIGSDWWSTVVPGKIRKQCRLWRNSHLSDPFRIGEVKDEPDYMSFGHLIFIIENQWALFKDYIVRDSIHYLKQLCELRNALSHPTDIHVSDIQSCKRALCGISKQLEDTHPELVGVEALFDLSIAKNEYRPIHNLYNSPYNNFVGRREDLEFIDRELLYHPNTWMLLIDGIGGIGKSSLAFRVGQEIIAEITEGMSEFQHVIWLSAKSRKLGMNFEIEDEIPDFDSLELLLEGILEFFEVTLKLDENVQEKQARVNAILEMTQCLIIVDNLETINDNSIYTFFDRIPSHNKVLLTSRDRRYKMLEGKALPLEGLEETESIDLITNKIRENNIEALINADYSVLKQLHEKAFGHPLILDCILHQIYRGKPVERALSELGDLIETNVFDYCFGATYSMLGESEQKVLMAVSLFNEAVGVKELIFVSDESQTEVFNAIENLRRFSLVKEENVSGTSVFYILPIIKNFVRIQMTKFEHLARQVIENQARLTDSLLSLDLLDTFNDPLTRSFSFPSKFDKLAASMASAALNQYQQNGKYQDAIETLVAALKMSPNSSYVCQVRAFIEKSEQSYGEAARWYQKATEYDERNSLLWRLWGDLERQTENYSRALEKYKKATEFEPDQSTWYGLGYSQSQMAKSYYARGQITLHDEHRRLADDSFIKALYAQPKNEVEKKHNVRVYHQQGFNLFHLGDYTGVLNACSEGLSLDPKNKYLLDLKNKIKGRL